MTVVILGGGPAGLALVDGLCDATDQEFLLLEKGAGLGGLAQTLTWGEYGQHDLGPHKIFTLNAELMRRVEALLPSDAWLTREKRSSIYMNGHFLPYPPSPFSLASVFGYGAFLDMTSGYAKAQVASLLPREQPATFEQDLSARVGKGLYRTLFEPIARKLWGDPADLDVKLSAGRVQTPSLAEVFARMLGRRNNSNFEALTFRYPRSGLNMLWNAIEKKSNARGRYLLGCDVTSVEATGGKVHTITYRDSQSGKSNEIHVGNDDMVFSTLPLSTVPTWMKSGLGHAGHGDLIRRTVKLNDLLLVFLQVDSTNLLGDSWVFVPDPEIAFHRVSEQAAFDPEMTPGGSIVCCEIMSNPLRVMADRSDAQLVDLASNGLHSMGYRGFRVLDAKVIRLPQSYPVYHAGAPAALEDIVRSLDRFENFRTIGRQGAFNYIGTLDAMDIGYGAADWLASGADLKTWPRERERTALYPVLD